MIKKVGIVTWNGSYNYGTNLQAYALYRKIHSMGFETYMLSYFPVEDHTFFGFLKTFYLKWKYRIKKRPEPTTSGKHPLKMARVKNFINQNFIYSVPQKNKRNFKKTLKGTDCVITGSDQIWNPYYLQTFYLLSMVNAPIRKVSYASSIGVEEIPAKSVRIYQKYLSRFDHLSLREEKGAELVKKLTGKNVTTVLDPTFLLSEQEWNHLAEQALTIEKTFDGPFILCYFVGDNPSTWDDVRAIQRKTGIPNVLVIPLEDGHYQTEFTLYETAGPCEFVRLIREATLVCTDSYHATALCLILKKDFIEFLRFRKEDPRSQNSRILEILTHYDLKDRFYEAGNERLFEPIDFTETRILLENDRKVSEDFLTNALR